MAGRFPVLVPHARVSVPRRVDRAVDRPRLLDGLLPAVGTPGEPPPQDGHADVVLVCAPAGYGKTTLLAGLADRQRPVGMPFAWVACDAGDDARGFWNAVLAAVRESVEEAPRLARLGVPADAADTSFVATLVEVLREEAPGLVLVLDDAHAVRSREVLDAVERLVEWADGTLRVVLGCRFEPPIGLHRLRLTGRLHEVRAGQLAFTAAEADDFWRRHGITLGDGAAARLLELTEGWPAGLRLAALALEAGDDPARFVEEFSGADQPVADYLAGEVLARLPQHEVDFLVHTSVVAQLSGELAVELSGRPDAAAVLEDLAERNALVIRLDHAGTWFRYHSLLRTYLFAALHRRDPAGATRLHATAARWFLEHGRAETALEHARTSGDRALLDEVLCAAGVTLLLGGSREAVRRAVAPAAAGQAPSPVVLVHRALLAVDEGDAAAADEALAALARHPDDSVDARLTSLRLAAALHRARFASALADARGNELVRGLRPGELPADLDPDVRLLVLADRGAVRLFDDDHAGARKDLRRAIDLARTARLPSVQLYCKNLIVGTYVAENDYTGGREAAERAIAFASQRGWNRSAGMAYSYAVAGWGAFQLLRPEDAARWAALAVQVINTTIEAQVEGAARTVEAVIAFDDPRQRRAALERLQGALSWLGDRVSSPALLALPTAHELRMCLSLGEWHLAEAAVARAEARLGRGGDVAVLQARLAAARGRTADAHRLLVPVLDGRLVPLRASALISAWLLEAVLAQRADRHPAASEAVLTALRLAAPLGAARPFFDAGPDVHDMLDRLRGRAGTLEPFVETVRDGIAATLAWQAAAAAANGTPAPSSSPVAGWLTERELDVLRDLPSMMTLGEIAGDHGISLNTVKTHVRSIYAKLGAGTRREAITTARGLGLI